MYKGYSSKATSGDMYSTARAYGRNGAQCAKTEFSSGGRMRIIIPIPNTSNATVVKDWNDIKIQLAESGGKPIEYYPAKVYDNLNSVAGYTTEDQTVGTHFFPVNNQVLNISSRSLNPLLGPLILASQSMESVQLGTEFDVEYVALNATSDCGRVLVNFYEGGVPRIFSGTNVMDTDGVLLGLGYNTHVFHATNPYKLLNQNVVTGNGETEIAGQMQQGYNSMYDGPCIKIIYQPNSSVTQTSSQIVGQLVVTFDVKCSGFRQSLASYNVVDWVKNAYSTSSGAPEAKTVAQFAENSGKQSSTAASSAAEGVKLQLSAGTRGHRFVNKETMLAVDVKPEKRFSLVGIHARKAKKEIAKTYGDGFHEDPNDAVIAGVTKTDEAIGWTTVSKFNEEVKSFFKDGDQRVIKDGVYEDVVNAQGDNYLWNTGSEFTSKFEEAPTCGSLAAQLKLGKSEDKGLCPQPFLVKDTCTIKDNAGNVCAEPENITSIFFPIGDSGDVKPVENGNTIALNQTIIIQTPLKEVGLPITDAAYKSASTAFDNQAGEQLESTEIDAGSAEVSAGMRALAANSIDLEIPKELQEMPEVAKKFAKARRAAASNGLSSFFKTACSVGSALLGVAASGLESKNAARYNAIRAAATTSHVSQNQNAMELKLFQNDGSSGNGFINVPECKRASVVENGVREDIKEVLRDIPGALKFAVESVDNPEGTYLFKVNNSYEICPSFTLGVSNPMTWQQSSNKGGIYYPQVCIAREDEIATSVMIPDTATDVFTALIGSRFPLNDPRSLEHCVLLTDPVEGYKKVNFNTTTRAGAYKNINASFMNGSLLAPYEVPMTYVPMQYINTISILDGFCIPDKLPDENGRLTELKEGERMYVYTIIKMKHTLEMKSAFYTEAKKIGSAYLYTSRRPLSGGSLVFDTQDHSQDQIGVVFQVISKFKRLLTANGDSKDPSGIFKPEENVNVLVSTINSFMATKQGNASTE